MYTISSFICHFEYMVSQFKFSVNCPFKCVTTRPKTTQNAHTVSYNGAWFVYLPAAFQPDCSSCCEIPKKRKRRKCHLNVILSGMCWCFSVSVLLPPVVHLSVKCFFLRELNSQLSSTRHHFISLCRWSHADLRETTADSTISLSLSLPPDSVSHSL